MMVFKWKGILNKQNIGALYWAELHMYPQESSVIKREIKIIYLGVTEASNSISISLEAYDDEHVYANSLLKLITFAYL